jgi:asparagine synthase (glutamine-hydrolysing)
MCGICGVIGDTGRLEAMSATLVHRGPDSDGSFVDGDIGFAARRLSIIDLETGDQPISNEDGTVTVVQNGEIYNYEELRRGLERAGHRFRTRGDTEVLAHAYEQWGESVVVTEFTVRVCSSEPGRFGCFDASSAIDAITGTPRR